MDIAPLVYQYELLHLTIPITWLSLLFLRGRIGRGSEQSYCLLFGNPKTNEARERLKIKTKTCDGFKIAEMDFKLR